MSHYFSFIIEDSKSGWWRGGRDGGREGQEAYTQICIFKHDVSMLPCHISIINFSSHFNSQSPKSCKNSTYTLTSREKYGTSEGIRNYIGPYVYS